MRDYKHKPREPWAAYWLLALVMLLIMLTGACTTVGGVQSFCDALPELEALKRSECATLEWK